MENPFQTYNEPDPCKSHAFRWTNNSSFGRDPEWGIEEEGDPILTEWFIFLNRAATRRFALAFEYKRRIILILLVGILLLCSRLLSHPWSVRLPLGGIGVQRDVLMDLQGTPWKVGRDSHPHVGGCRRCIPFFEMRDFYICKNSRAKYL